MNAARGYSLGRTCRVLLSVDEMLGKVVRKLEKQGRLENTMLILTSDNGMTFGSHRILTDKKSPYATQIPLYIRWPRVLGLEPREVTERVQERVGLFLDGPDDRRVSVPDQSDRSEEHTSELQSH